MSQLHQISGCGNDARKGDVIFLHGLGGDGLRTWRHGEDASTSWPHWLGEDFADVGIWSVGYAASPTVWARLLSLVSRRWRDYGHSMALTDRGNQVLDMLVLHGIGGRPILLVCHSLGGLLAKQILRTACDTPDQDKQAVFENTRAVLFLATPHAGARLASKLEAFRRVFRTTISIEDLRAHDAHLRELLNWYRNHAADSGIETSTYFEWRRLWGFEIVDPTSAHPGVGDDPVGLDEDHLSIATPRSRSDQVYRAACRLLRDHVLQARSVLPTPADLVSLPPRAKRIPVAPQLPATLPLDVIPQPASLPPRSRMGLWRNPRFVGRAEELRWLAAALKGDETGAEGIPIVVLTGLGGVGKTQLASEFVHCYGQFFAGGVFWLNFADVKAIGGEIVSCGDTGFLDLPDFNRLRRDQQVNAVRAAWQSTIPCLLVFDDCKEEGHLAKWRPTSGGCRVLVTSTRASWDSALGVRARPLGVLQRAESVALLRKDRADLPDADLEEIADELGNLPLALHLAGGYLARYRHATTAAQYLQQLRSPELLQHPSLRSGGLSPTGHEQDVWRTFALSYRRLDPTDPIDDMALALLARASWFHLGEEIPYKALLESVDRDSDDHDAVDAVARLRGLGLLDLPDDGGYANLHRLLAVFIRAVSTDSTARSAVESTARVREMIRALFDNGAEVFYPGGLHTGIDPIRSACNNDVKVVYVTVVSGAQMIVLPRFIKLLRSQAPHRLLVADGAIPPKDAIKLKRMGISAIVGPETTADESARKVFELVQRYQRPEEVPLKIMVGRAGPEMWKKLDARRSCPASR